MHAVFGSQVFCDRGRGVCDSAPADHAPSDDLHPSQSWNKTLEQDQAFLIEPTSFRSRLSIGDKTGPQWTTNGSQSTPSANQITCHEVEEGGLDEMPTCSSTYIEASSSSSTCGIVDRQNVQAMNAHKDKKGRFGFIRNIFQ